jgi:hypothetical protein
VSEVGEQQRLERRGGLSAERRLRGVLDELATACSRYGSLTSGKGAGGAGGAGRTKLDKERAKLCQREIVSMRRY